MGLLDRARLGLLTRSMAAASRRTARVTVDGLHLTVAPDVCHPAPALGLSFASLFRVALEGVERGERVLDVGTGTGVWALMASRAGAQVVATDLPHVPLEVVRRNAADNRVPCPDLRHGSLFAPVAGERFRRVLFNPPFHFGEPRNAAERATLGGAGGEVVHAFLEGLPAHLEAGGAGHVILPRAEQAGYAPALARSGAEVIAHTRIPVLGRVSLLRLRPEAQP